jgi:hypothetical protein
MLSLKNHKLKCINKISIRKNKSGEITLRFNILLPVCFLKIIFILKYIKYFFLIFLIFNISILKLLKKHAEITFKNNVKH